MMCQSARLGYAAETNSPRDLNGLEPPIFLSQAPRPKDWGTSLFLLQLRKGPNAKNFLLRSVWKEEAPMFGQHWL